MSGGKQMSLYKPVLMDKRVSLSPNEYREAVEDLDSFLTAKLRKTIEGRCSQHGWIRPGSVTILARSMGQAEHGRFTGDFIYYCKVRCLCLTPHANQIMDGQVFKANKMGAYVLVISDGRVQDAMRILVPRDLHMGQAEFDELSAGMTIRVRVLRSRFQAGDEFIQAVGTYEGQVAGPGPVSGAGVVAEEVGAVPEATGAKEAEESKEAKAVEATA